MTRRARTWLVISVALAGGCIVGEGAHDRDGDGVKAEFDCDDHDAAVSPSLPEICGNGIDDDCDGIADGADSGIGAATFFKDGDGDGYGDPTQVATACATPPPNYVGNGLDCDDARAGVNPGRLDDTCDGISDDCDEEIDEDATVSDWYEDADGDGFGAGEPIPSCDPDEGWVRNAGDCDDSDDRRYPGAAELCNGIDDNCVLGVDEGLLGSGRSCAADSCQHLYDELGAEADGSFWLDGPAGAYQATCDVDDDFGGGWMVVDLPFVEGLDLAAFETGGASGGLAAWNGARTGFDLDPGGGDQCATNPRWSLVEVTLPETYTELRGGFTLSPIKPSSLPHIGLDNDTDGARFTQAPRCVGTDYRGSVLFGNEWTQFKASGLSEDWSGRTDTDYVFSQPGPRASVESDQLWWQLAGIHPDAHTGGRVTQIRIYVR